jgi:hypothetical protein
MSTKFKNRFLIFIAPVTLMLILFIGLVQFSGPNIRNTLLKQDPTNQQLIVTFNADISNISDVVIEPNIPLTYSYDTFQLFVNFEKPLKYNTDYSITLKATDTRNKSSVKTTNFKTINPNFYYLLRNDSVNDTISVSNVDSNESEVIYEAEEILLYDFTKKSMIIVENEQNTQKVVLKNNNKKETLILPDNFLVDNLDASSTQETYVFTLVNSLTYEKSVWEYKVTEDYLYPVTDDQFRPVSGSSAQYAPDGKSIFYFNNNRSFVLLSDSRNQPPIDIGSFDSIQRILPNEKGIYGLRNNNYTTVLSSDGSQVDAPKDIQNSSLSLQFNSLTDYIYVEQQLDSNRLYLEQKLISFVENEANLIRSSRNEDRLILITSLSPNDEFLLTEESLQPVIYDGVFPNGKPKNGFTNIIDIHTGEILKTVNGYDIKWVL